VYTLSFEIIIKSINIKGKFSHIFLTNTYFYINDQSLIINKKFQTNIFSILLTVFNICITQILVIYEFLIYINIHCIFLFYKLYSDKVILLCQRLRSHLM